MDKKGILLFGGTFDPVHNGHLIVARAAAEKLNVSQTILIPAAIAPHKQGRSFSDAKDRLAMVRLAIEGDGALAVSDCEIARSGPSYTLDTIRYFRGLYGADAELYWLIGADSLCELHCWYKIGELVEQVIIVTAGRPGSLVDDLTELRKKLTPVQIEQIKGHILDTPLVDISSTDIRERVRSGLPVNSLLPEAVAEYIMRRQLYQCK
jgi:nicotinate-nucleotide adenylyltransferase